MFLMSSVNGLLYVIIAYLTLVHYGLKFMKGRNPFRINGLVVAYDWIMVVMNAYMLYESVAVAFNENYSLYCQKVDYSSNPNALRVSFSILRSFYRYGFCLNPVLNTVLSTTYYLIK